MNPLIALLAAVSGYLAGSVSFARIIRDLVNPDVDISKVEEPVPHSDAIFVSDSVSATAARVHLGTRYGCLTAILDMSKVAVPTLLFELWQPNTPYFLIVAVFGVLGHDLPLYHGFKGGRGESAIFGGLFVVDWLAIPVTNAVGAVLGLLSGNLLVLRWAGLVLTIPWLWFRTHDLAYPAYALAVNAIYWVSMVPELKQYFDLRAKAADPTQEELAEFLGMGLRLGRVLDRYNLFALKSRLSSRVRSSIRPR